MPEYVTGSASLITLAIVVVIFLIKILPDFRAGRNKIPAASNPAPIDSSAVFVDEKLCASRHETVAAQMEAVRGEIQGTNERLDQLITLWDGFARRRDDP